ncbi:MAG: class I SAM-dependent methyltransferase [Candidatus Omnitrophica bacterium]|nr:class I SAM-dependent methyltransferase [Candidatus Omnitrophota bacterium]
MQDRNRIAKEARAFDKQTLERVSHGHIPDLRQAKFCRYFYNSPWRDPAYVKLDFGEQFELINSAIKKYSARRKTNINILEVGCGPGYLSLELARTGYHVTGIDISAECIRIAKKFADSDPWKHKRASLQYLNGDFLRVSDILQKSTYDVVIFLGTLHHFKDQRFTLKNPRGIVIVHEPTRDRVTEGNAAFMHLVQLLLSVGKGYYRNLSFPSSLSECKKMVRDVLRASRYEDAHGKKVQSVNDNESGHLEMYTALKRNFKELVYQERYAFFHEIIGGLRFGRRKNAILARYLRDMDHYLCELGVLQATEYFFVGRKIVTLKNGK